MKCDVNAIIGFILGAIGGLAAAIAVAYFWPTVIPLFIAAGLVAGVAFGFIPAIRSALASCSKNCNVSSLIDLLGQVATVLSLIGFVIAAVMQISALAFIASWVLTLIGVGMEAAVAYLVYADIAVCFAVILLLSGLLSQVLANQKCLTA